MEEKSFAAWMKELRIQHKKTMTDMASLCGISFPQYWRWETGRSTPRRVELVREDIVKKLTK